ncbi:Mannuronan synthase [Thalassocella blandensis]|nr:Mannuronan synthase [Thalassocella blandensis]
MSSVKKTNLNLVHESEAQRQYARVKIPATVRILRDTKSDELFRVYDISAGGFSINASNHSFIPGNKEKGQLVFVIDGFKFLVDVEFETIYVSEQHNKIGFQFQNISQRNTAALRYIITSFLSGEIVSVGDMVATIGRENYTSDRKAKSQPEGQSALQKTTAFIATAVMFVVGLAAAFFVATQLYNILFVVHSKNAVMSSPAFEVEMPKSGAFKSLVSVGDEVQAGQPIATMSLPLLGYLNGSTDNIGADELEALATRNVSGTLSSPCDCVVSKVHPDSEFIASGASVVSLSDKSSTPAVEAYFDIADANDLHQGDVLTVEAMGTDYTFDARIESISVVKNDAVLDNTTVRVVLEPLSKVDSRYSDWPLAVSKEAFNIPEYSF